jgi:hypothetical protein
MIWSKYINLKIKVSMLRWWIHSYSEPAINSKCLAFNFSVLSFLSSDKNNQQERSVLLVYFGFCWVGWERPKFLNCAWAPINIAVLLNEVMLCKCGYRMDTFFYLYVASCVKYWNKFVTYLFEIYGDWGCLPEFWISLSVNLCTFV